MSGHWKAEGTGWEGLQLGWDMFGVQGLGQREGEQARPGSGLSLRAAGRLAGLLGSICLWEDPEGLEQSERR